MKIQLVLWVAIVLGSIYVAGAIILGSAWLEAAILCSQSAIHSQFGEANAQRIYFLSLLAIAAIVATAFAALIFGAHRELKKKNNIRIPRLSFAETMVHLSLLVGAMGLILGVLS
ncbi:MAG: hypothetical protein R3F51_14965 [Cyanobacteriota/Melainabacteria group bacterium]